MRRVGVAIAAARHGITEIVQHSGRGVARRRRHAEKHHACKVLQGAADRKCGTGGATSGRTPLLQGGETMARNVTWVLALALIGACSKPEPRQTPPAQQSAAPAPQPESKTVADEDSSPEYESVLPEALRIAVHKTFTGDFDEMVQRRIIRIGVTFNRTFYFVDKGAQRGLAYEYVHLFEEQLNRQLGTGNLKVHVVMLPMPRDALLPSLRSGKIDAVVAQLTVTPARQQIVDFSQPTRRDVDEIVVTGPGTPPLASLDDLSDREVFARKSSSYYDSLVALNHRLTAAGRKPVKIVLASEALDDDDLLEMVNAGLMPAIVVDNYLARFWKQVFTDLTVHDALVLRSGGALAVAIRRNSPQLAGQLNAFIASNSLDSSIGAILNKRYLQSTKYVKNATSDTERRKFLALIDLFRRYGGQYRFDYLLMAAQGYQESRLDQSAKSPVGAIGIMQLMPETAKEQRVGDVTKVEPNVHAGVKYMRSIRDTFFEREPMDDLNKGLFTFAAYNAGPGRVKQLRAEAKERGLDPDVWFGNVERVASERIGRETVTYVSNIYKYYVAYKLLQAEAARRKAATPAKAVTSGSPFE
jgi:membrane-bound lytic murein transglycosylase MltF